VWTQRAKQTKSQWLFRCVAIEMASAAPAAAASGVQLDAAQFANRLRAFYDHWTVRIKIPHVFQQERQKF
jgi:hypothetical protein